MLEHRTKWGHPAPPAVTAPEHTPATPPKPKPRPCRLPRRHGGAPPLVCMPPSSPSSLDIRPGSVTLPVINVQGPQRTGQPGAGGSQGSGRSLRGTCAETRPPRSPVALASPGPPWDLSSHLEPGTPPRSLKARECSLRTRHLQGLENRPGRDDNFPANRMKCVPICPSARGEK